MMNRFNFLDYFFSVQQAFSMFNVDLFVTLMDCPPDESFIHRPSLGVGVFGMIAGIAVPVLSFKHGINMQVETSTWFLLIISIEVVSRLNQHNYFSCSSY